MIGDPNLSFGTKSKGHGELLTRPVFNTNKYQNFIKIKFFNVNYNSDQATQKKIKKAILNGKINYNNANYYGTNMMSKFIAPFYSYKRDKNLVRYYPKSFGNFFGNLFLSFQTSYDDLDFTSTDLFSF